MLGAVCRNVGGDCIVHRTVVTTRLNWLVCVMCTEGTHVVTTSNIHYTHFAKWYQVILCRCDITL